MTPYYEDELVTLYHGDALEVTLPHVDLIVTDPPYGETSLAWDRWVDGWPKKLYDLTRQMWCFGSFRMFFNNAEDFDWWRFGQEIVWEKHNGSGFQADRFRRVHELVTHWYHGQWTTLTINPQMTDRPHGLNKSARRRGVTPHTGSINQQPYVDDGTRLMRSVLFCQSEQGNAVHPTQKPLAIIDPLIRYSTNRGDVVLDPFAGSGSTLLAAKLAGRKAIGVEINEEYCEIAAMRLSQGVLPL